MFFNTLFWLIEKFFLGTPGDQKTTSPEPGNINLKIHEPQTKRISSLETERISPLETQKVFER